METKLALIILNTVYLVLNPPDLLLVCIFLFHHLLLVIFAGIGPYVFIDDREMIILMAHLASSLPGVKLHIHDPSPLLNALIRLEIGYVHKFIDRCSIKPPRFKWLAYKINHNSRNIPLQNPSRPKEGPLEETLNIKGICCLMVIFKI